MKYHFSDGEFMSAHERREEEIHSSLTRRGRTKVGPDKSTMQSIMAWRPYSNLIDGELDNRVPGKVTGWMRFYRTGKQNLKAVFDLTGDFHEDIRGKMIRLSNPEPSDKCSDAERTYMEGFARVQRGTTGDITAGVSPGPWTSAIAEKLMAQNELIWEEAGLSQAARESRRRDYAERYRKHIDAGDLFYPYVDIRTSNGIRTTAAWFWSWTLRRWRSWRALGLRKRPQGNWCRTNGGARRPWELSWVRS